MPKLVVEEDKYRMVEPQRQVHHPLVCSSCGEQACDVVEMEEIEEPLYFRAKCPCGEFSYVEEVKGQPFLHPAEGKMFENFISEEIEGKLVQTIVTRKAV